MAVFALAKVPASHETAAALTRLAKFAAASGEACALPPGSVIQAHVNVQTTDTQATLYRSDTDRTLVLAFPGTQSEKDGATDANDVLCPYTVGDWTHCNICQVHCGFLSAYSSVDDAITEALNAAEQDYPEYRLQLVGHSLGGALAQLAYISLARKGVEASEVFTYGQPRVGDKCFADLVDAMSGSSDQSPGVFYRSTHSFDGIPQVPATSLGYRHACTEYWQLGNDQSPEVFRCFGQEPEDCNMSMANGFLNDAHGAYFGLDVDGDTKCA